MCPVATKVAKKRKNSHISGLGGNFKAGTGPKTCVELWYHKPPELSHLSDAQLDDLLELRPPQKGKGRKGGHHKRCDRVGKRNSHDKKKTWENNIKGQVAAAMKRHKEEYKEGHKKETEELAEIASFISAVQPTAAFSNAPNSNAVTAAVKINEIIKQRQGVPWLGAGAPHQILSYSVGGLIFEPNKNEVDKIMMSVSSVGESAFYLSST